MKITNNLDFPLSAVTETFGYLACRGAGKTNAARSVAEAFFAAKLPFVVVDPVGSWWGLLSSRDGEHPGLPILVLGGKHGHLPLERDSGELVADLIVEHRLSCVLDLTLFESEGARKKFLLDFARRLYLKNEEPLHLFLEEADDYISQRPMRDEAQLLRAWENIVRRGRARGLGMSMITQRSAALNKNVLTQVQTLVTLRTTGPQDRAAIEAWLKYNDQSSKILAELPKLENGEAWVWSPTFLKETKKVKFRLSHTFDSGATPTGAKRAAATLADVDLGAIEQRMSATVEKARAEDPKLLRRRIAELERELLKKTPLSVEVPVRVRFFDQGAFDSMVARTQAAFSEAALSANQAFAGYRNLASNSILDSPPVPPAARTRAPKQGRDALQPPPVPGIWNLKAMHRAMLTALAQHPAGLTKRQVLIHTSYASSGPVSTAFADLAREGYVEGDRSALKITPEGVRVLGPFEPLPVGRSLQKYLLNGSKLSTMEKALLRVVCEAYPDSIQKSDILNAARYASSGPVSSAFAKLVAYGYLVPEGRAVLRAAEELF